MIQISPDDEMILVLEKKLQSSLLRVQPNPEFVDRLKVRLSRPPGVVIEKNSKLTGILIVIFGLVFGIFLVWLFLPKSR